MSIGTLQAKASEALAGTEEARMRHFLVLDPAQQAAAVRRLHATGLSEHDIARATGLSPLQIQAILTGRPA